jgi:phage major head subunit gpT-like protein
MTIENRARFNKDVVPGLFALMTENYKRYEEVWRKIVRTDKSTEAYEESAYITGFTTIGTKGEGEALSYIARQQGETKRWTHDTLAAGARVTEEAIEDSRYGIFKSISRDLGVSVRETRNIRVAAVFNTGFDTTTHTTGQGYALFYGSHVKLGGGTWSNLATASSLSYSTLQSAIQAFENQTDSMGKKILQSPMILLVPPALEWKAMDLLRTVSGAPETANNSINVIREGRPSLTMIKWPFLTSSTAWFLIGDNARTDTGLIMFERVGVTFGREGDFDTGDVKFKVRWRDSVECNVPIGLYGNAGA